MAGPNKLPPSVVRKELVGWQIATSIYRDRKCYQGRIPDSIGCGLYAWTYWAILAVEYIYYRCNWIYWNVFLRDIYIPRSGVAMTVCRMMRHCYIYIISCLVAIAYFNCIGQDSLYYNMDIGTLIHCALVSCTLSQSIALLFWVLVLLAPLLSNQISLIRGSRIK